MPRFPHNRRAIKCAYAADGILSIFGLFFDAKISEFKFRSMRAMDDNSIVGLKEALLSLRVPLE